MRALRPDLSLCIGDDHAVIQIMFMRIDIGVVGDRRAFMNDHLATVIEQHVFVDGAVVFDGQVVTIRDFHAVEYLHVLPNMFQHMLREHGAHAKAEPMVQPHGRAIEHHPEPDEWLARGILRAVHIAVVLRFQGGVAGIETMDQRLLGQGSIGAMVKRLGGQGKSHAACCGPTGSDAQRHGWKTARPANTVVNRQNLPAAPSGLKFAEPERGLHAAPRSKRDQTESSNHITAKPQTTGSPAHLLMCWILRQGEGTLQIIGRRVPDFKVISGRNTPCGIPPWQSQCGWGSPNCESRPTFGYFGVRYFSTKYCRAMRQSGTVKAYRPYVDLALCGPYEAALSLNGDVMRAAEKSH